jgi:hypothetical protein
LAGNADPWVHDPFYASIAGFLRAAADTELHREVGASDEFRLRGIDAVSKIDRRSHIIETSQQLAMLFSHSLAVDVCGRVACWLLLEPFWDVFLG